MTTPAADAAHQQSPPPPTHPTPRVGQHKPDPATSSVPSANRNDAQAARRASTAIADGDTHTPTAETPTDVGAAAAARTALADGTAHTTTVLGATTPHGTTAGLSGTDAARGTSPASSDRIAHTHVADPSFGTGGHTATDVEPVSAGRDSVEAAGAALGKAGAAGGPQSAVDAIPAGPEAPETVALSVSGLAVTYPKRLGHSGSAPVLSGVELEVRAGQILGVIGETGSGKTTLARAVVGMAPVVAGRIGVAGVEVGALRGRELRAHRRSGLVQYMFQDPLRSLDPDLTVNDLVGEPLAVAGVERAERRERVAEALHRVGLDAGTLGGRIPAQLSGGQRQRVSLARAIVTRPALLLADEPVSALDASNRNHVLRLLDELRRDLGVAVVVISHDLSSLAGIADRIAVLYRGRLVEQGPTADVLAHPLHPYTALLTASAPRVDRDPAKRRERPGPPGEVPAWAADPGACVFAHRCPLADADCRTQPGSSAHPGERAAACHHPVTA